jgi:anti-sigma factor RsiW
MNEAEFNELWERALCGRLTAPEQARFHAQLAADPALQALWAEEQQFSRLLRQLPDAPVPSNFTARVLQAVATESRTPIAGPQPLPWLAWLRAFGWTRATVAIASVALGAVLLVDHQRDVALRAHLAESISAVSSFASLPSVEILQDFEAIARLDQTPAGADEELLAALQ